MPGHSYRAAEYEAIVRDVLGDVSLGADRIAAVVEATRAPEPDRLALARIGRERDAALARYRRDRDLQALEAAMAALDEQEAEARDRQPAPELSAAEVVAYLRDLPRLWDEAPDSRRGARRVAVRAGGGPGAPADAPGADAGSESPRASWRRFRAHLLVMVGARGFEPPTSSSRTMRATKLRHAPTVGAAEGRGMIPHAVANAEGDPFSAHPAKDQRGCGWPPRAAWLAR